MNLAQSRRDFIGNGAKMAAVLGIFGAGVAMAKDSTSVATKGSAAKRAPIAADFADLGDEKVKAPSQKLPKRKLGGKLEVSALGLGCMGMSHGHGPARPIPDMVRLIREAYDLGVTYFDTAEIYGPHTNEELLGLALKPIRDKVIIGTKFGLYYPFGKQHQDSSKKAILRAVDGSLRRLGTDYIDIYTQHRVDTDTPIEEVADTMRELVKMGKIRFWGLSEAGAKTIEKAAKEYAPISVQSQYSISFREHESDGVIPTCQKLGIGFVAYSPLDRGLLTGEMGANHKFEAGDMRSGFPRYQPEALKANQEFVEYIRTIAKEKNASIAQISLAWLLAQSDNLMPIPETTKSKHLRDNLGAINVKFTADELAKIDEGVRKIKIVGERFVPGSDADKSTGL